MLGICWTHKKSKTGKTKGGWSSEDPYQEAVSMDVRQSIVSPGEAGIYPIRWLGTRGKFLREDIPYIPVSFSEFVFVQSLNHI